MSKRKYLFGHVTITAFAIALLIWVAIIGGSYYYLADAIADKTVNATLTNNTLKIVDGRGHAFYERVNVFDGELEDNTNPDGTVRIRVRQFRSGEVDMYLGNRHIGEISFGYTARPDFRNPKVAQ